MNIITNKFTKDWIRNQVHFWLGQYCWLSEKTWETMGKTTNLNSVLTLEDTVETMLTKDFPKWKEDRCLMHLNKIKSWSNVKDFTKDHVFPFRFSDNAGHTRVSLSHSRPFYQGHGILCILDDVWARQIHGANDATEFEEKLSKVHFLGSFTGPFVSTPYKTSRLEIISKWFNAGDWVDLGFIEKPKSVTERPEYEEKIKPLIKPYEHKRQNLMNNKYILCIEGNDCCSSFSWALASNCVPIHTYPFASATHFINGLEPYRHFVPIKRDGSDLREAYEWCENNQDKCKQIAENGREHMKLMQDKELCLNVEMEIAKLWDLQKKHLKS